MGAKGIVQHHNFNPSGPERAVIVRPARPLIQWLQVAWAILRAAFLCAILWPEDAAAAQVVCAGTDDTAAIQSAVDLETRVELVGNCRVNGWAGVRIPSGRTIAGPATVTLIPGCTSQGWPCRIFETIPGHGGITIRDMVLVGEPGSTAKHQILIRIDRAVPPEGERWSVRVRGVRCIGTKSDCVHVGGNAPSRGVWVTDSEVDGFGRNGFSVVHADDVLVDNVRCANAKLGTSPGACIDVESNAGEQVTRFTAHNVYAIDCERGVYAHRHPNGRQGQRITISGSRFVRMRTHCVISNSNDHVGIFSNRCEGAPVGISVGAFTEETRSTDVNIWGNYISANRAVLLPGVRNVRVLGNDLQGGRVETPALGVTGKAETDNELPPAPTPTPSAPEVCTP